MPKIRLKPNSAEYADDKQPRTHHCDMPGCSELGLHKAPKHRALNEYYIFCIDHVQEYNRAWNFFEGMNDAEVMDHLQKEYYGHRPTWKYGVEGDPEDILRQKASNYQYGNDSKQYHDQQKNGHQHYQDLSAHSQEFQALAIMGLEPPVTLKDIKTRYKELAKKHHPDLNKGDEKSATLLKRINMAYTILRLSYEQFEELPER